MAYLRLGPASQLKGSLVPGFFFGMFQHYLPSFAAVGNTSIKTI